MAAGAHAVKHFSRPHTPLLPLSAADLPVSGARRTLLLKKD